MSLHGLLAILERHPEYRHNIESASGPAPFANVTVRQGARPAFIASLRRRRQGAMLVITPRPDDARRLHDHLLTYLGEDCPVLLLPEPEVLPYERLAVDANTSNQRLSALASLAAANGRGDTPCDDPLVVCSVGSALLYTLPPSLVSGTASESGEPGLLRVGDHVRVNDLLAQWLDLGYRNEPVVESPGSFSHRGGILDLFPATAELPLRIELFDDEIDTIRAFDPFTQRLGPAGPRGAASPRQGAASRLGRCGAGRRPHHRHGLQPVAVPKSKTGCRTSSSTWRRPPTWRPSRSTTGW